MNPKKIWCNLAVVDLNRTTRFYTALGFRSNMASGELTSISFGESRFIINFFLESVLRKNIPGDIIDAATGNEAIFTLSAESRDDADRWEKEVEKAGGKIISRPQEFGKGYYGFVFTDPDGHKFNVFHM